MKLYLKKKIIISLLILLFLGSTLLLSLTSKIGGVAFRVDAGWTDPVNLEIWKQLFDTYGFKVNWAFSKSREIWDENGSYEILIREMQQNGHNVYQYMGGSSQTYVPMYDTLNWQNGNGEWLDGFQFVDDINFDLPRGMIEFSDSSGCRIEGATAELIAGTNTVRITGYSEQNILVYLYGDGVPDLNGDGTADYGWYKVSEWNGDIATLNFRYCYNGFEFLNDDQSNFVIPLYAHSRYVIPPCLLKVTVDGTRNIFRRHLLNAQAMGLEPPTTFTNNGGNVEVHPFEAMIAGTELGYTNTTDCGLNPFGYNEPPEYLRQWRYGWKSPLNTEDHSAKWNIAKIADGIAKHQLLIDGLHPHSIVPSGHHSSYMEYFASLDSVLYFCNENNIPVRTFGQWTDSLYVTPTNPNINIIPDIRVDLDENGIPDGYYSATYLDSTDGIIETDSLCFATPNNGNFILAYIDYLMGIEKGWNTFGLWVKGGTGDGVGVRIRQYNNSFGTGHVYLGENWFYFDANSTSWIIKTEAVEIYENTSFIHIYIYGYDSSDEDVKVTGMQMKKYDEPLPVNLSSFYALYLDSTPTIYWTTQTEINNAYWNVYRGLSNSFETAILLNVDNPVLGNGATNYPSDYVYVDDVPVTQNQTYWYWIEDVSLNGSTEVHDPITLTIPLTDNPTIPDMYGLYQNYPNPFNPHTSISFKLEEENDVEVVIYNIKGEKIKTIFKDHVYADHNIITVWDGNDTSGKQVSSGIYFYKLKTENHEKTKRMILLK
ncbi:MAG: T9SS type A sorting domain-containing protein [Candidatus Tenebribacter burtonii]|nr:T9SS type A sorting domain-containing protein [Candidatus Tenebribacter burtonii]